MEKPTSSFWGRVLDNIPGFAGKRDYDRAQAYIDRTHFSPEEFDRETEAGNRSYTIKGKINQYALEQDDISKENQFQNQVLGFPTEMPERFLYQNAMEDHDISTLNQLVKGTEAGTVYENDDMITRAIDKDYVVSPKAGKYFMGVIPYGWKGGMRKNPGIDHRIDPSHYQKQIEQSGTAPLLRMQMYQGN